MPCLTATRTPEGWWNHCPICGSNVCVEPSILTNDAPCPVCGHLLWFTRPGRPRVHAARQVGLRLHRFAKGFVRHWRRMSRSPGKPIRPLAVAQIPATKTTNESSPGVWDPWLDV